MATKFSTLKERVRIKLQELSARYWTDAEILAELNDAQWDLQKAINAEYQDYYFSSAPEKDVFIAANGTTVTGVPTDVMIIRGIEPRVPANYPGLEFKFRPFNSAAFMQARALTAQDPTQLSVMLVAITGAAGPVGAGTIHVAPPPTTAIPLRLSYIPTLPPSIDETDNPIPGQSDKALICYAVAYCRSKVREDQSPDPDWLALYATEKQNLLIALAPRQEQDDQVAEGMFEDYW